MLRTRQTYAGRAKQTPRTHLRDDPALDLKGLLESQRLGNGIAGGARGGLALGRRVRLPGLLLLVLSPG